MTSYMTRNPIGRDPMYDDRRPESYVSRPVPRVKPEASHIATAQQGGSIGFMLGITGKAVGPSKWKKNDPPKDHFSENVKRMRQIQRKSRKKEQEAAQPPTPVKALWKSEKFKDVQSKVVEELEKEPPAPRPHSANFLRSHSRCGAISKEPRAPSPVRCQAPEHRGKSPIPRPSSAADTLKRNNFDFIRINGHNAKYSQMKRAPSLTALDDLKKKKEEELQQYERGKVPKYLQDRKQQWKKEIEDRIKNRPDPDLPPGHKLMPKEERLVTLGQLKETQAELLRQLNSLPIRSDTLRVRTKKEELETKMAEVEEAIKIFSRPKVFVKIDS
ncbi:enkurin domain-containing protein 1-like [Lingula anatina]|uniref:Enkurin domain-containing protein 1-like n=1 Tax=Lingula anatina TaxID=7574 RepID=A0A1S3ILG6_LINAN|nr:enkurin domain-containing protein 1-like [Lingula anatina]|eukprot:XP_013399062.1 enkurin domain-containing protein 1-like [Lingula anatina]